MSEKKGFKANPADLIIKTQAGTTKNKTKGNEAPKATKATNGADVAEGFETKSKRLNLLIRPSIFKALKEISHDNYTSVNNMINEILEQYINDQNNKEEK